MLGVVTRSGTAVLVHRKPGEAEASTGAKDHCVVYVGKGDKHTGDLLGVSMHYDSSLRLKLTRGSLARPIFQDLGVPGTAELPPSLPAFLALDKAKPMNVLLAEAGSQQSAQSSTGAAKRGRSSGGRVVQILGARDFDEVALPAQKRPRKLAGDALAASNTERVLRLSRFCDERLQREQTRWRHGRNGDKMEAGEANAGDDLNETNEIRTGDNSNGLIQRPNAVAELLTAELVEWHKDSGKADNNVLRLCLKMGQTRRQLKGVPVVVNLLRVPTAVLLLRRLVRELVATGSSFGKQHSGAKRANVNIRLNTESYGEDLDLLLQWLILLLVHRSRALAAACDLAEELRALVTVTNKCIELYPSMCRTLGRLTVLLAAASKAAKE